MYSNFFKFVIRCLQFQFPVYNLALNYNPNSYNTKLEANHGQPQYALLWQPSFYIIYLFIKLPYIQAHVYDLGFLPEKKLMTSVYVLGYRILNTGGFKKDSTIKFQKRYSISVQTDSTFKKFYIKILSTHSCHWSICIPPENMRTSLHVYNCF